MATLHDTAIGDNSTGTAVGSIATADTLAVTAGDLIVIAVKHEGASTTITPSGGGLSWSTGNAYLSSTQTSSTGDLHMQTFYATATSTTTITPQGAFGANRAYVGIKAYSFTPAGGKTLAVGNVAASQGDGISYPNAGSASATAAGASIMAAALYGTLTLTPGSGWSQATEFSSAGASNLVSEYQLQTGSGSLTGNCTTDVTWEWLAQMIIFNEADAGGPAQAPRGMLLGVG